MPRAKKTPPNQAKSAQTYNHTEDTPQRPDIGTQAQFKKQKPPTTYRYDSSIAPALSWDTNPSREEAEALIQQILGATDLESAQLAANKLKRLSQPFLDWAGKAERLSFDVPTLPLFVHERLSTRAIIDTLNTHIPPTPLNKGGLQLSLFADPQWTITDQILKAYEYQDKWVNRMILGDSLVTMNSLLQYEGMGGQVQMIYIDPPYGVKFGSNFQPFVRKRDVKHNDDSDLTREPETVKAYRDTWELGLHSYLSYLRDRFLLARDLLTDSGSIFVQISDENIHHVRELLDEVFGSENFNVIICYKRLGVMIGKELKSSAHYLLWYSKDKSKTKFNKIFDIQIAGIGTGDHYTQLENIETGEIRTMTKDEKNNPNLISPEWKPFQLVSLQTYGVASKSTFPVEFEGKVYKPSPNKAWRTNEEGFKQLLKSNRIVKAGSTIRFKQFLNDFPLTEIGSIWEIAARDSENFYVVQTPSNIIQRCLLMTTDPGDLVIDLTCGSGTTAYVAEQWGRRWITCDVSRVPLALARQRLLTATFPWYQLKDHNSPSGGFVYQRKQNKKGEEIGGIVPHITLKSIANNEPPEEEILVDRPEIDTSIVRVCSPFTIEGTIPPPVEMDDPPLTPPSKGGEQEEAPFSKGGWGDQQAFTDRMLEVLRQSPVLHLPDHKTVELTNIRQPAKSQNIHAEALTVTSDQLPVTNDHNNLKPVAFVFGSENGAIAERTVYETAREAHLKGYSHLYVIGFAISANARQFVEKCAETMEIPATYIQATPDLLMGDLLKNMRSSQIFSVCGLPDIKINQLDDGNYQVELLGLDVFDPVTMELDHQLGNNVPAWFLDTNYNGLCFYVRQAFFPRTSAWDSLKKALKGSYDDEVWEHLAGTVSAPFVAGEYQEIAVKVIDDRGNELLVVKSLKEKD